MLRSDPDKVRAWQQRSRETALRKKSEKVCGKVEGGRLITRRGLRRTGGLRARSPRKAERRTAIARASRDAAAIARGVCAGAHLLPDVRCAGWLEIHHAVPRSTAPELVADPVNLVALCSAHHAYVGDHPAEARTVGLHGHAGDDLAAMALLRSQEAPGTPLAASGGPTLTDHYPPTPGGSGGDTACPSPADRLDTRTKGD